MMGFKIPKKPREPDQSSLETGSKLTDQEKLERARKLAASLGKKTGLSVSDKVKKSSENHKSDKSSSRNHEEQRPMKKSSDVTPQKKPTYLEKLEKLTDQQKLEIIKKISGSLGRKDDKISDEEKLDKIRKISETIGKSSLSNDKKDKGNGSLSSGSDRKDKLNGTKTVSPLTGKIDRDKLSKNIESLQKIKRDFKEAEEKARGSTITMLGKTDDGIKREVIFDRSDAEKMRQALQDKAARIKAMMNKPEEPKPRERKKKQETGEKSKSGDSNSEDTQNSDKRKSSSSSSDTRKSSSHSSENRDKYSVNKPSNEEKPKKKLAPPPAMNFNDLLKIAEQKSQEPVVIEVKKPVKEEERLMTKKELASQREYQEYLKNKAKRKEESNDVEVKKEKPSSNSVKSKSTSNLVPKSQNSSQSTLKKNSVSSQSAGKSSSVSDSSKMGKKSVSSSSLPSKPFTKDFKLQSAKNNDRKPIIDSNPAKKMKSEHSTNGRMSSNKGDIRKSSNGAKHNNYDNVGENVLVCGPPKAEKPGKPVTSNPFDRIYSEIKKNQPTRPVKRKHPDEYSESEDELDEDLDGFVVDYLSSGEEEEMDDYDPEYEDYSKHIRDIFGYDKRKYKYESDYDIANMEANFRDVMKEEARSARLGLQEDLEDMRKEEEEKKRKMAGKKKMK